MKRLTINPSNKPYYSEDFIKGFEYGTQRQLEADLADKPRGEWKEVYAETDYRNGWIEFSCECCGHQHGLESGEYGWSYGEPIPWKFCPLCGARMFAKDINVPNKKGADDEIEMF